MTQDSKNPNTETPEKQVYIAGKITDLPDYIVKPKFKAAEEVLNKMGYKPFNPYERLGRYAGKWEYRQFMNACLNVLLKSDYAYFLYDWKNSPGAIIELKFAIRKKIPVFNSLEDLKIFNNDILPDKTKNNAKNNFLNQIKTNYKRFLWTTKI